jgi:hypothetical protein
MKRSYASGSKRVNNAGVRRGPPNRSILRRRGPGRASADVRSGSVGGRPAAPKGRDVHVSEAGVWA